MENIIFIILIFLLILILPALRLFLILKYQSDCAPKNLTDSINNSSEKIVIAPERGSFRGSTNKFGRMKCDGTIALTDKNIHFLKSVGRSFKIDLQEIDSITTDSKFLGSWRGGMTHLIVNLKDGSRIGFFVKDIERWKIALMNAAAKINHD